MTAPVANPGPDSGEGLSPGVQPARPRVRPPRRTTLVAISAVVVAVVVVLSLVFLGFIPLFSRGSSSPSPPVGSYLQASRAAEDFARSVPGGPWGGAPGAGWSLTEPYTTSESSFSLFQGCVLTSGSGMFSIPGPTHSYSSGLLSQWTFTYGNADGSLMLLVEVENGVAFEVGTFTNGLGCAFMGSNLTLGPPSPVNSNVVAHRLLANGTVSEFVATHAFANSSWGFTYGTVPPLEGWEWAITYTTCDPFLVTTTGETGSSVGAAVNATTGALIMVQSSSCF